MNKLSFPVTLQVISQLPRLSKWLQWDIYFKAEPGVVSPLLWMPSAFHFRLTLWRGNRTEEFWVRLSHFHKSITSLIGPLSCRCTVCMERMSSCFSHPTGYHRLWKGKGHHICSECLYIWSYFTKTYIWVSSFILLIIEWDILENEHLFVCAVVPSVGVRVWWDPEFQSRGASDPHCSARERRPGAGVTWQSAGKTLNNAYWILHVEQMQTIVPSRLNYIYYIKCKLFFWHWKWSIC